MHNDDSQSLFFYIYFKEGKTGSRTSLVVSACAFLILLTAAILGALYLGSVADPGICKWGGTRGHRKKRIGIRVEKDLL